MEWLLVIFVYGGYPHNLVNDTKVIDNFPTEQMCEDARKALKDFRYAPAEPSTGPVINNISVCIRRK